MIIFCSWQKYAKMIQVHHFKIIFIMNKLKRTWSCWWEKHPTSLILEEPQFNVGFCFRRNERRHHLSTGGWYLLHLQFYQNINQFREGWRKKWWHISWHDIDISGRSNDQSSIDPGRAFGGGSLGAGDQGTESFGILLVRPSWNS